MAYDTGYDDPKVIDAFLANMRGEDDDSAENDTLAGLMRNDVNTSNHEHSEGSKPSSDANTPALTPATASPHFGTRAPPPTPESAIATAPEVEHLPPINEDSNEGGEKFVLPAPKALLSPIFNPNANTFVPQSVRCEGKEQDHDLDTNSFVADLVRDLQQDEDVKNYHQDALNKFQIQAATRIALRNAEYTLQRAKAALEEHKPSSKPAIVVKDANLCESKADDTAFPDDEQDRTISSVTTEPFPSVPDESTAVNSISEDSDSSIEIIVDAVESPEPLRAANVAVTLDKPNDSFETEFAKVDLDNEKSVDDSANTNGGQVILVERESRENATYFSTWGVPATRNTSPARVRKIILTDLPPAADLTLVQSLIHGGAIETMTLSSTSSGTVTVFVTFTDADACDSYYEHYPNGLEFKYKGKRHVAFIHKGQEVDVMSGALQSYLDCGATRVVKATNADEDWSMRALYKIAEGTNAHRKVEAIFDSYRNDTRTIVFRFTKIVDAVAFRGHLLRSSDWEDADVQFMADPCEKATGIH